tara:strand:+ start:257 stop:508 length:252 start_codon:yes stop_codon:yes gene_type:complete
MGEQSKNLKSVVPGAGVAVKVLPTKSYPRGDINYALKAFKREVKDSGKMEDFNDRRYYVSKGQKRKKELERAKYFQYLDDQEQ